MSDHSDPGDVLILGAGFSKAVNPALPLANRLGQVAYDELASTIPTLFKDPLRFSDEYPFEVLLSRFAESQPYLQEAENRENALRFVKLNNAIVSVLERAQRDALMQQPPAWFYELLSVLHHRHNTVISLNYDTLIEVGLNSHFLQPEGSAPLRAENLVMADGDVGWATAPGSTRITPEHVLQGGPPLASPPTSNSVASSTMRLLKLHGSLDWWWVPGDETGATLCRQPSMSTFGNPVSMSDGQRRQQLPGREPFIIPPLATKSPYYRNPLTRQIWQDAFEAVAEAKRIVLVGYSLPHADIVMSGMLEAVLRGRDVQVDVINSGPDGPVKHLKSLGSSEVRIEVTSENDCVATYVRGLCDRASAEVARHARNVPVMSGRENPVFVDWSKGGELELRRVTAVENNENGLLTLITDNERLVNPGMRTGQPSVRMIVSDLAGTTRIMARSSNGHEATVVGYSALDFDNPNVVHQLHFFPAGQLPS